MLVVLLFFCALFSWGFDYFYAVCFLSLLGISLVLGGSHLFGGVFFLDSLSFFLVFLSLLVFIFCIFSSALEEWVKNYFGTFLFFVGGIFFFLFLSFSCFSFMFFYISFEFIFVLMFFFVLGWGYSPERLQASFYMVFYTLVVSFPFLVYVTFLGAGWGEKFLLWGCFEGFFWLSFIFVFLVKLPVYGVHLWLPKAHVEAPVSGSMVLAGVLLKLGGYGILRFSMGIGSYICNFKGLFVSLGLLGGLLSCFLCLRQSDLKAFVAYSSVCHMGFGLGALFSGFFLGCGGGVFMMIGHGFCSSCLFYVLYVLYERFHSRSLLILKGLSFFLPMLSMVWFMFSVLNMGVPPSFSFFSEIMIFSSLSGMSFTSFFGSSFLLLFSGFYGIFLFVICAHGGEVFDGFGFFLSLREFLNFFAHLFFLVFLVFSLEYFYL